MTHDVTRRDFMKTTAAIGAATLTARQYAGAQGANDRLNVGFIGCGGMAGAHIKSLLAMQDGENIAVTAVCDVYRKRAQDFQEQVAGAGGKADIVEHHSELLARDDIDYAVIATPEHSHHRLTIDALNAGKHVYCEKPLCHSIEEAQEVVAKARETGLKLQVGVQGMADDSYASAYEAIASGKIGPVVQAQIDYVRNHSLEKGPWRSNIKDDMPKPDDLNWDEWLKPRADKPWNPHHYFEWRCYRDYSGGVATDLFVHRITRLIRALGLTYPERVVGMGGITMWPDGRDLPDNFEMLCEYPAIDGITPGLTVNVLGTMANKKENPHCIRGHAGTLYFRGEGWEIVDEKSGKITESHKKTGGEDVTPHHKNHHAAIRNNAPLNCPAELGLYGVVAVCMGNASWFERKMIAWKDNKMQLA